MSQGPPLGVQLLDLLPHRAGLGHPGQVLPLQLLRRAELAAALRAAEQRRLLGDALGGVLHVSAQRNRETDVQSGRNTTGDASTQIQV